MFTKYLASSIVALAFTGSLHAAQPMSTDEVRALMTGNTMNGKNLVKNLNFTNYYREDGTTTKLTAKGKKWQGTWRVTDDGQHCVEWKKKKREQCGAIIDLGNDTYRKMAGDKPRIEFTVTAGNAKDL